jgi:dTDP-4-dehydrorhamnose reductase
MRVLITGAKGQLGQDLMRVFSGDGPLQGRQGRTVPEVIGHDIDTLDITDFCAVKEEFLRFRPDTVIHGAAYTDVDGCEANKEAAYNVNVVGTANIAVAANQVDASVLCVSTDYVFDGLSKKPYTESDPVNPQSIYGKTKLAGEIAVQTLANKFYIARTAWLYGHGGTNFVKTIQKVASEKGALKVVDDQIGSPTFTLDLANKISEIVKSDKYGIYHVTNSGECSWYKFTKEILKFAGIQAELSPCTTEEFQRPAQRPVYSVLSNYNLEHRGFSPMRPWLEALKDYFDKI